jgi:hypothetical protein
VKETPIAKTRKEHFDGKLNFLTNYSASFCLEERPAQPLLFQTYASMNMPLRIHGDCKFVVDCKARGPNSIRHGVFRQRSIQDEFAEDALHLPRHFERVTVDRSIDKGAPVVTRLRQIP